MKIDRIYIWIPICINTSYFARLFQQIKEQSHKMKVLEIFEWFKYIKDHSEKSWHYEDMCENPNVTQAYPQAICWQILFLIINKNTI